MILEEACHWREGERAPIGDYNVYESQVIERVKVENLKELKNSMALMVLGFLFALLCFYELSVLGTSIGSEVLLFEKIEKVRF